MTITKTISEIKSQASVQEVEHAFFANLHGKEVLFVKATGGSPVAYCLPEGFIEKLEASPKAKGLFPLGQTYMTPGAIKALQDSGQTANEFLIKHQSGNWGEVDEADWNENDFSVKAGYRILSAYRTSKDVKIWVITEADRSSTVAMLPSEY